MVVSANLTDGQLGRRPCACGNASAYLCDKRTGYGTQCDAQVCETCVERRPTGDLCTVHQKPRPL